MAQATTADARIDTLTAAADALAATGTDATATGRMNRNAAYDRAFDAAMNALRDFDLADRPDGLVAEVDGILSSLRDGDVAREDVVADLRDAAGVDDSDDSDDRRIDPDDVAFDPHAIAAAWEAADDVPVCVAVAITNEFTDHDVTAAAGEQSDRDVVFDLAEGPRPDVLFEEKAVGVCPRDVAEEHAPAYVDLPNRDDDYVLAVNPAQIFD